MKIHAILWDYDGTLVNSATKNIEITKQILEKVAPRLTGKYLPACLLNEEAYHIVNHQSKNWQDLYLNFYGMSENEMYEAGALWSAYQLTDNTPVKLFTQVRQTIEKIQIPQGICSQNSSENIARLLIDNGIDEKFQSIIGYDDIPKNHQKPNPFGGIKCLERMFANIRHKTFLYIGDHEGDVVFARNIEKELNHQSKVIAVTVKYSGADTTTWSYKPDFEIESPSELIGLIEQQANLT